MNTILTVIDDDEGQEARLKAALDLAHALSGHLVCLDVMSELELARQDEPPAPAPTCHFRLLGDSETDRGRRLRERLAREDVEWELVRVAGDYADCVVTRAGLADIIVLDRKQDVMRAFDAQSFTSRVALRSRKPILSVPQGCEGIDVYGRSLIAWDGSSAAMASLTAAVPLLKSSMAVTILEVQCGSVLAPAEEAAAYLSRSEIHAHVVRLPACSSEVAPILLDSLVANSAEYCVMGAYGHSPLYEALFGGVTQRMLANCPVPMVIAH